VQSHDQVIPGGLAKSVATLDQLFGLPPRKNDVDIAALDVQGKNALSEKSNATLVR
jgi:hypothetical protein